MNDEIAVPKLTASRSLRSESDMTRDGDEGGDRPSFVGGRYRDASKRVWQELSLVELASNDLFLKIVG